MRYIISIFLIATCLITGCASTQKEKVYIRKFDSGTVFEKASSQCQYEVELESRADARTQKNSAIMSILMSSGTMRSCMNRFGFDLVDKNSPDEIKFTNEIQQKREEILKADSIKNKIESDKEKILQELQNYFGIIDKRIKEYCGNASYKSYFNKTTCHPANIKIEHLTDQSEITEEEKLTLISATKDWQKIWQDHSNNLRKLGNKQHAEYANFIDVDASEIQIYTATLYQGKINWGEYNILRKKNITKHREQYNKIYTE